MRLSNSDSAGIPPTIVVRRGGRIVANGTADAPITFTALAPGVHSVLGKVTDTARNDTVGLGRSGKWGGVVIAGNAPGSAISQSVEGLDDVPYGGPDPRDDSGVLRYVRIYHGGAVISANIEINGLTLAGVGNGTQIEYVEVAFCLDDGVEIFGGTVNLRHISVLFVGDDAFDIDEGYTGQGQYLFAMLGHSGDHAIEVDSQPSSSAPSHLGYSQPSFFGLTLLGGGLAGRMAPLMLLRSGAAGSYGDVLLDHGRSAAMQFDDCGIVHFVLQQVSRHTLPHSSHQRDRQHYHVLVTGQPGQSRTTLGER